MKIIRFSVEGRNDPLWGVIEGDRVHVTSTPGGDRTGGSFPVALVRLLAPALPTKIVCVGRNYHGHIREMGNDSLPLPKEPGLFLKSPNTLAAPFSEIPGNSRW